MTRDTRRPSRHSQSVIQLTSLSTLSDRPTVRAELAKSMAASTPPLQTFFVLISMYSSCTEKRKQRLQTCVSSLHAPPNALRELPTQKPPIRSLDGARVFFYVYWRQMSSACPFKRRAMSTSAQTALGQLPTINGVSLRPLLSTVFTLKPLQSVNLLSYSLQDSKA